MLAKDLKPGDYLWGLDIEDFVVDSEIDCYYINKITHYCDGVIDIKEYEPILNPNDTGYILIPDYFDISNVLYLCYGSGCVWAYSTNGDKIAELYTRIKNGELRNKTIRCFLAWDWRWDDYTFD